MHKPHTELTPQPPNELEQNEVCTAAVPELATEINGNRMDVVAASDFDALLHRLEAANEHAQRLEQFRTYVQEVCEHPKYRTRYTLLEACAFLDEIRRQAIAAANPISAMPAKQTNCRRELLAMGKAAPRTCQRCGLMGRCTETNFPREDL